MYFNQHNLPILVQLPIRLYIGQSAYLSVDLYSVCLLYIHLIHLCYLYVICMSVFYLAKSIVNHFVSFCVFYNLVNTGNGFKNKKTPKQELHQEYFCFLDEQFYFDQQEGIKIVFRCFLVFYNPFPGNLKAELSDTFLIKLRLT